MRILKRFKVLVFCLMSLAANAQQFINAYTDKSPGAVMHPGYKVATDGLGNVINGSTFSGSLQIGASTFASNGALGTCIVKRDANDSILWSRSLTCGAVVVLGDIFCDNDNNIYVTGLFGSSTIPSPSTTLSSLPFPITIPSGSSAFVVKYAPTGSVLWAISTPVAPGTNYVNSDLFRLSGNGTDRIAITAPFVSIPSVTIAGTVLDTASCNMFWAFADSSGNWTHASSFSMPNTTHLGMSLSMAPDGTCYFSGSANGSLNFGTAGTLNTAGTMRDFIAKINTNGSYDWYRAPNGAGSWWRTEVLADNNGAYFIGSFNGSAQFGSTTLTSSTFTTYMARLSATGSWSSASKYGASESRMYAACRNANRIFISGYTDSNIGTTNNTFGTYQLNYAASLSPSVIQSYDMSYLIEVNLSGQVVQGATFANSFATLNVGDMAASNNDVYLTGPVTGSAYFASFFISDPQLNACNYVAKYGTDANMVRGNCYFDFNSNNVFDGGDLNSLNLVNLQGGAINLNIWANGTFAVGVNDGVNYTISTPNPPTYYTTSPSSQSAFFAVGTINQVDSLNDFAFQPIPNQNDLEVSLTMGAMRPGFSGTAVLNLKNVGTTVKSGMLNLLLNSGSIAIDSITPIAGTAFNGNAATFSYNVNPMQQVNWWVRYQLDSTVALGTWIQSIATVSDPSDLTPINNFDTVMTLVTGAYDPNNKLVSPDGNWNISQVSNGLDLEYTINFQNTGTDTAFTVVVTDSISNLLDLSTLELLSSSHPVSLSLQGRQVWFRFYNINLPDSNINEPLSHGNIRYRIRPITGCVVGDVVTNRAYIYFDFNQPIVTNTTINQVVVTLGIEDHYASNLKIFPNPASDGWLNVESDGIISKVVIHDISGRQILEQTVVKSNRLHLDVRSLNRGIYLIKLETKNGAVVERFVR
ncbi:MAG: T9SS type A sorting domain-containing protein [Bacteroidia bacterium]